MYTGSWPHSRDTQEARPCAQGKLEDKGHGTELGHLERSLAESERQRDAIQLVGERPLTSPTGRARSKQGWPFWKEEGPEPGMCVGPPSAASVPSPFPALSLNHAAPQKLPLESDCPTSSFKSL